MSVENNKTLEVYQKTAKKYIEISNEVNSSKTDKKILKKEKLHLFLKETFNNMSNNSNVFEIGSAEGENAKYIQSLGFKIVASDVADDFIIELKKRGLNAIKFNVLEDDFPEKYGCVFCWRVFVHFTKDDVKLVLNKVYSTLSDNGIFIFNVMNKDIKNISNEWIDFPGEYNIGMERYYNYFSQFEIDQLIDETNFKMISFHKEGGQSNNKWLVYVLKKEIL